MNAHYPTSYWTEPPSTGVAAEFSRAYLVEEDGVLQLEIAGPSAASLIVQGSALHLDDDPAAGKRPALRDREKLIFY